MAQSVAMKTKMNNGCYGTENTSTIMYTILQFYQLKTNSTINRVQTAAVY